MVKVTSQNNNSVQKMQHRLQVLVDDETRKMIEERQADLGLGMAAYIRQAVREEYEKNAKSAKTRKRRGGAKTA